jgi:elongation factor P--(R)-beta-lysine ligase
LIPVRANISHGLKNKFPDTLTLNESGMDWQPSCSFELLRLRARMLQKIRQFFADRLVLEVETPLLCHAIGTDPHLNFFSTECTSPKRQTLFLQTSPEFAMKRLLAAGCGSIYQICKAFRNGEAGRYHNPEFTLLEWYRVGFDLSQLMDEAEELITALFGESMALQPTQRISYQALFQQVTGLNPLLFFYEEYASYAENNDLLDAVALCGQDHSSWLDFIFSHQIQPKLALNTLWLIFGYPACLPSLAKVNVDNPLIVERAELFINGVELGNGYHELCDAEEQARRFDKEIASRQAINRPAVTRDDRLLAALEAGLPDCSGIAIGLDRILMLLSNSPAIDEVLAFSISRA